MILIYIIVEQRYTVILHASCFFYETFEITILLILWENQEFNAIKAIAALDMP